MIKNRFNSLDRFSPKIKPSLLALAVAQAIAVAPTAQSAIINLGGGCLLVDAVTSANKDTATGNCTEGSGADVIYLELGGTNVYLDRYAATPNGLPVITSDITINGDGGAIIRFDGNIDKFRLMEVSGADASLTLNSLTLRGGHAYSGTFPNFHGGAIYLNNSASLVGNNLVIENNIASKDNAIGGNGGAINGTGASVELNDSLVSGNQALGIGGGIYVSYGDLELNNTEISSNNSRSDGGGIGLISSPLVGDDLTIYQNTAGSDTISRSGGGIWAFYNANVEITNSTVEQNEASARGGGFFGDFQVGASFSETQIQQNTASIAGGGINVRRTTTVNVTGGTISNNSSGTAGGGVYASAEAAVTLQSTTVSSNSAGQGQGSQYGGGALVKDSATLISNDTQWMNNYSRYGGAIATRSSTAGATIDINNSTFTANSAAAQGGALRIRFDLDATINQSTFSQNYALNGGGAIGNLTGTRMKVMNSTIFNNSSGGGAGISNSGELTVVNSTISGNTANNYGGGLFASYLNTTVINSTIVANQVLGGQGGGGIQATGTGNIVLHNSIVAGNAAPAGAEVSETVAGLIQADANNLLGSSNVTTAVAFSLFTPGGSDVVATSDSATGSFTLGSMVNGLANNKGPTLTRALAKNSPAINAGDPTICSADMVLTDQRGEKRDNTCDIGAYEVIQDSTFFVVPLPGGKSVIFGL